MRPQSARRGPPKPPPKNEQAFKAAKPAGGAPPQQAGKGVGGASAPARGIMVDGDVSDDEEEEVLVVQNTEKSSFDVRRSASPKPFITLVWMSGYVFRTTRLGTA